jgi:hypothetical protein
MVPTLKPLTGEDLLMLREWIQRPHVRQWWKEPTTLAELTPDGPALLMRRHREAL